jgi:hypothetical protein
MKALRYIALLALAAAALTAPSPASAASRQVEGTVTSVNSDANSFRLRDSQRGTFTIKVTSGTRFQRIAGFGSLRKGMTRIEATVRRSNGRWIASTVERSGGGGRHGDDD